MSKKNNGKREATENVTTFKKITLSAKTDEQREVIKSIKSNEITFIHGLAGTGKAQPLYSTVYTTDGPKKMGDIKVGDTVCTPKGKTANVIGVFPQGEKSIYRMFFADGDFVDSCAEHLWQIYDNRWGSKKNKKDWVKKPRIKDTLWIKNHMHEKGGKNRFKIFTPNEVKFNKNKIEIDPYLLGILLGDGCISGRQVIVMTADEEIVDNLSTCLLDGYQLSKQPSHKYDYSIKRIKKRNKENDYVSLLKEYYLMGKRSHDKFIPDNYKYNTRDIRLSIIQGLMDSDGYISKGLPEISITSERLANDIKEIISSLGGVCSIKEKESWFTHKGERKSGRLVYRCYIKYNESKELFRLNRKKEIAVNRSKYPVRRVIKDICKIGEEEAQCILIDDENHLYLTDNCVITHNTHIATVYGLKELLSGRYGQLIFTRPCKESMGEKLGSLPGDSDDKIAPYMMPLFEILRQYISQKEINNYINEGLIRTIPLAYYRGITFNNSFIVADEFQNTIPEQMRLFLTRFGKNSKIVITGDVRQSDLGCENGMADAMNRLQGIKGIAFNELSEKSIVRHPIIGDIEARYNSKNIT